MNLLRTDPSDLALPALSKPAREGDLTAHKRALSARKSAPGIAVRALTGLVPEAGHRDIRVAEGTSLEEIVARVLPGATSRDLMHVRVVIAGRGGAAIPIEREHWRRIRPKAGTAVHVRIVPEGDDIRTLLSVVVTVAALALGQFLGGPLATALGYTSLQAAQTAGAIITAGTLIVGTLAINALVPVQTPKEQRNPRANYEISGWRNAMVPDGVVPQPLGKHRYAPPFAMMPYSEVIDDRLYICAIFNFGYGPQVLSDHRIGETPIERYDGVQQRVRLGNAGNNEINLFPRTVIEHPDAGGIELIRPLPRNARGEVIEDDPSIETPVRRTGAPDTKRIRLIFGCPAGMIRYTNKGEERYLIVEVRIQGRLAGAEEWEYDETIKIGGKTREAFYRQHEFALDERGTPDIRITRMTDERTDPQKIDRVVLVALQSIRPEYPVHFDPRLCLVGIRIRSSDQLNGMLDSYNAVTSSVALDWDHEEEAWVERETHNPASLCRLVHQGPANADPTSTDDLDLDSLIAFHDFCRVKNLRYDRIHDFEASRDEVLEMICAAGRAIPRDDGQTWGVVIDRPQDLIIDMLGPRNTSQVENDITYIDPPDGFRVSFLDRTNDFASAEMIIPWPGFSGTPEVLVQIDMPGVTHPTQVWKSGRRRQYEAKYRRETMTAVQDGMVRMAVRGDMVAVSHYVLGGERTQARVKRIDGAIVTLDDMVTMEEGENYGIQFAKVSEGNIVGQQYIRQILTEAGETWSVQLLDDAVMPGEEMLVFVGKLSSISENRIVQAIEPAEGNYVRLTLIMPSDLIDEYTDEEEPPEWTNRVGGSLSDPPDEPGTPTIERVLHGLAGTDSKNGLQVQVKPDRDGDLKTVKIEVDHKLDADSDWNTIVLKDGERWAEMVDGSGNDLYEKDDDVNIRARGIGPDGEDGPYCVVVDVTIGSIDDDPAEPLDPETVTATAMLGYVEIAGSTIDDEAVAWIQLYRNQTGTLNRETDAIGERIPVRRRTSFVYRDGDPSRKQKLERGNFGSDGPWAWTGGWNVANGRATKTPGSGGDLYQFVGLADSVYFRVRFVISGWTDGLVRPRLAGSGSPANGNWVGGNGTFTDRILNTTGNDRFVLDADADFDGRIEEVYLIRESAACLDIGTYHYFAETQNGQDVPAAAIGPMTVDAI